jgi:hypothetical protein
MQEGSATFEVALNKFKIDVTSLPLKPEPRSPMFRGSHGIRDQFSGDPWLYFRNGYFKVYLFFN